MGVKTKVRGETEWSEKRPLLVGDERSKDYGGASRVTAEVVVMKKHVTLMHAIGMIVGGVAGSGIFISPTGVTMNVGSVGLSLIMWTVGGLLNLLLALCYAELGTALPLAGGDYAYLHYVLGPLPAFLCLWTTVLLIGPCCGALMGRTVGTYIFTIFGVECNMMLVVFLAIWVNISSAWLNCVSVKWAARILTLMSFAKLIALSIIVITGIVSLAQGNTQNFEHPFEGSKVDTWSLVGGFLPGFVAYVGWDAVNSLAEEMKNPGRDLPLSVSISMIVVILIYILTNIAYFSVLTPTEFVMSDAVATSFAERALGSVAWTIPIVVAMSAGGSAIGAYLAYPRYAFAGGREGQLPRVMSMVSLHHFTPIPGIISVFIISTVITVSFDIQDLLAMGSYLNQVKNAFVLVALLVFKNRHKEVKTTVKNLAAIFFSSATFFDLQGLLSLTSVISQFKMVLTLMALVRVKCSMKHLKRTVKVPLPLVIFALAALLCILCLAVLQQPMVNGVGLLLFLLGIPIYLAGGWCAQSGCFDNCLDAICIFCQQLFHLVPGGKKSI